MTQTLTSRAKILSIGQLLAATLLLGPGAAAPVEAQTPACRFQLGFETLHGAMAAIIGDCLENEHYNAIGDSNQQTTNGLLAWRKSDNWTAFTDGYRTWVNGPYGIQERLNTERFAWEHDTPATQAPSSGTSVAAAAANAPGPPVSSTPSGIPTALAAQTDTPTSPSSAAPRAVPETQPRSVRLDPSGTSVICRDGVFLPPNGSCDTHGGRY